MPLQYEMLAAISTVKCDTVGGAPYSVGNVIYVQVSYLSRNKGAQDEVQQA